MDYFNFDDAAPPILDLDLEEVPSIAGEVDEEDAEQSFEALFFDKSASLPTDPPLRCPPTKLTLANDIDIEVVPHAYDSNGVYPMFRAKEPCDLCRRMGLDCFLASRGALINGCTCCISLYRECSFTHQKGPRGLINTFPGISEDAQVCEGSLVERRKPLKSFEESRGRKTGARFPRDAVKILKRWLSEHTDHPYPNEREKDELKQLTGLKRSQISNWLANARRRGKVRPVSGTASPMLGAIDIPNAQGNYTTDFSGLAPLDRWKASPPEHEPASMTAIARAMTTSKLPVNASNASSHRNSLASSRRTSSEDDSGSWMFQAPSVSSFDTARSSLSDLSFASSRSHRSKGSFASSVERRRRKRAPVAQRAAAQNAKSRSARIFQCTFCADSFPAKYDWQRHEKSLHLALERWTCCPNGGIIEDALTGSPKCVFCPEINPSPEHLETHNFVACFEKTLQERTFYRKDHLRQHLKLAHGVKFDSSMEAWKSTTNEIKSRCGFCPSVFSTWQARVDHLAAHFKNGADMSNWSGGWGFEPFVERLVENSVPPYLIGFERSSMDPYVAKSQSTPSSGLEPALTHTESAASTHEARVAHDSNCWHRLEEELTKYIDEQKKLGLVPSDTDLQCKGRVIVFDDDDPWNQTPADNRLWLETLKYQTGIGAAPSEMEPQRLEEVPMMAPYVVRGGLRHKEAKTNHSDSTAAAAAAVAAVAGHLRAADPSSALLSSSYDPIMDIDFDQLDFSAIDIEDPENLAVGGTVNVAGTSGAQQLGNHFGGFGLVGDSEQYPGFDQEILNDVNMG